MSLLGSWSLFSCGIPLIAFLLLAIAGARGQDLEVLQTPGPLSLKAGENLILDCTLKGVSVAGSVRWYKGLDRSQQPVYSDKASQRTPRVTRIVPEALEDFSIRISNIWPEDAGTYYCVKFRAGSPERELKSGKGTVVSVRATPSQPSISGPPSRVTAGASVTFNCTSDGFVPRDIEVTWYKDRSPIPASPTIVLPEGESTSYQASSTVKVSLTDKDVKSQLTCQIKHPTLKGPLQQVFRLGDILRVPPTVRLETSPPLPIPLNVSAKITCSMESFYPNDTSLVWLVNGKRTKRGKASFKTQNSAGTFSFKSSLEVFVTERMNQTVYTCKAEHNSRPLVIESLTLEVGLQPGDEDEFLSSSVSGHWLFTNPGLWIGLTLSKAVGALFLAYLLRKECGKIAVGPTASPT